MKITSHQYHARPKKSEDGVGAGIVIGVEGEGRDPIGVVIGVEGDGHRPDMIEHIVDCVGHPGSTWRGTETPFIQESQYLHVMRLVVEGIDAINFF